jgi:hypothetical protein
MNTEPPTRKLSIGSVLLALFSALIVGAVTTFLLAAPSFMSRVKDHHLDGMCLCTYTAINGDKIGQSIGSCGSVLINHGGGGANEAAPGTLTAEQCSSDEMISNYKTAMIAGLASALFTFGFMLRKSLFGRSTKTGVDTRR